jgi:hypothetical protein
MPEDVDAQAPQCLRQACLPVPRTRTVETWAGHPVDSNKTSPVRLLSPLQRELCGARACVQAQQKAPSEEGASAIKSWLPNFAGTQFRAFWGFSRVSINWETKAW